MVRRVDASARADLLDSIEDGYVLLDDEGRVTDANQRARDLLASDDLTGDRLAARLSDVDSLLAKLDETGRTDGHVSPGEWTDAERFAVQCVTLPGAEDGSVLVTFRDVTRQRQLERRYRAFTDRKRRQRDLRRQNDRLEVGVTSSRAGGARFEITETPTGGFRPG